MKAFRISKCAYIDDKTGIGAKKYGGRWNSIGTSVLYFGDSRALCTAEIAVHTTLGNLPKNYCLIEIEIPHSVAVQELSEHELPHDWMAFPHNNSTKKIGDFFVSENNFVALKVPSSVVLGEYNFILNPAHSDFSKIIFKDVVSYSFDSRLFLK